MEAKVRKVLATGLVGAAMLGMAACGTSHYDPNAYEDVYSYGYYDGMNVYHVYDHPHRVHVTYGYAHSHSNLFSKSYATSHTHVTTTKTTKVTRNPLTGRRTTKTTTHTRITRHH